MQSLPLLVSVGVAAAVVPAAVRGLLNQGFVRENYRGRLVAFPAGIALIAASLVALVPLALVDQLDDGKVFRSEAGAVVTYVLGVALLGLIDDVVGSALRTRTGRPRRGAGGDMLAPPCTAGSPRAR